MSVGTRGTRPQYGDRSAGRVYFLDGAGGGSVLSNWGGGVVDGLREGGFRGDFVPFHWQTGYGAVADQNSSVAYKRTQGAKFAANMRRFARENPDAPIYIIALSAGTAVTAYALESLPTEFQVDQVIFLGSSLSDDYNLTRVLRRIRGELFVLISKFDPVLWVGVTVTGTADRTDALPAGVEGFQLPARANPETRTLYRRLHQEEWKPEYALKGHLGGHTGGVQSAFVRDYLVPRLKPSAGESDTASPESLPASRSGGEN